MEEGLQARPEQAGDLDGGYGSEPVELEEVAGDEGAERDRADDPGLDRRALVADLGEQVPCKLRYRPAITSPPCLERDPYISASRRFIAVGRDAEQKQE